MASYHRLHLADTNKLHEYLNPQKKKKKKSKVSNKRLNWSTRLKLASIIENVFETWPRPHFKPLLSYANNWSSRHVLKCLEAFISDRCASRFIRPTENETEIGRSDVKARNLFPDDSSIFFTITTVVKCQILALSPQNLVCKTKRMWYIKKSEF